MQRVLFFTCVTIILLALPVQADPIVLDFNSSIGFYPFPPPHTESGVTFSTTISGLGFFDIGIVFPTTPNGTPGLIALVDGNFSPVRANISTGATYVSVDMGDFDEYLDNDDIYLYAYSLSDDLLDQALFSINNDEIGEGDIMHTLSVSAPNISYVVMGSTSGLGGSSVFYDNFTFNPIPEPTSLLLLGTGFGVLALAAYRRKRK